MRSSARLTGRFPDNQILSHDLLEGCYARAGLVSDVQLYEDYPARYALDVERRHRWIRGDWQLLPWLLPWRARSATAGANAIRCRCCRAARSLDNLRRSLVPAATTRLLLLGWLLAPRALDWTLWVLSTLLVAPLMTALMALLDKPPELPLRAHLLHRADAAGRDLARIVLAAACLPYEAFFSLDAIARTLVADAALASPDAAVESVQRSRAHAGRRTAGVAALDVVRAGVRDRDRSRAVGACIRPRCWSPRRCWCCGCCRRR